MTAERYNTLLRGALYHPIGLLTISRLSLALESVTTACGKKGADALEAFCKSPKPEVRTQDDAMSIERFNELVNRELLNSTDEPIPRLVYALKYVVDTCGPIGDLALESWCEGRDAQDLMDAPAGDGDEC
jgi:hypothetical protein